MNSTLKYSVRLITEAEKLTEALNLRYKTYKNSYPKLVENTTRPFETDEFDRRSLHLGLYCENGEENVLAGYCRLILPQLFENDYTPFLVKNHHEYTIKSKTILKEKLAYFKYLPNEDYEIVNLFCDSLEKQKNVYSETSRFIVDDKHRSLSLCSFFVSSLFAVCESLNIKYNFFLCSSHHAQFYSKSGLTLFPGIAPCNSIFSKEEQVIFGTDLSESNAKQPSVKSYRLEFEEKNHIVFRKAA